MVKLTALYGHPQDAGAFDRYYEQIHAPLAKKIRGLKGFTTEKPVAFNPQEKPPYYLIANLYMESMEALQAGLQAPEGQAAAADLQNFATGGVTLFASELDVLTPVSLG